MRWLGPMLHLIYPPTVDPVAQQLALLADERRDQVAALEQSRRRLESIAVDPLDTTLTTMIEDLHQC